MTDDKKGKMKKQLIERQTEAKVVRKIVLITAIILFVIIGVGGLGGFLYVNSALKPVNPDNDKVKNVEIPIGSSVSGIGQVLEENGIIKDARVFKYYVKLKNESGFMAGTYELAPAMTLGQVISELKTGNVDQEVVFKVTLPEGKQLEQIAAIIAEKADMDADEVFAELNDKAFVQKMQEKFPSVITDDVFAENIKYPLEGYLFPATYDYYKEDATIEEIITPMIKKTSEVLTQYTEAMEKKEMSVHELLTMASLIEEEATAQVDRDKIASVFYNRMDEDMPLQTDPTVLYAHGEHKERTLYKHLEIDDPYNTYKYNGLTPGPIANAGSTSIEAALNPEETDYLYFLATPEGEVLFSKTLDEHNVKKNEHITSNN
ncbi:endolytic transglycosylase MltG [Cytobacillus kochii]|uniref:endolytic transglycosylase MltG n=1 Tax=Cytobacillus kochii TaxID=859143 RepID=UPI001CD70E43|nr:endolytic transglycosylase MltG [Cytobacillus kochii]MCA1025383.1 endolytic transglycosylase MltG [Cytobacillus kochii]MCM3324579.1 endolytic transglycosylase MltG [Cytobacillus kochii]MCM3346972.1 endolytic transglycosylase MltG [Cytobacillus kochii]